MLVHPGDFVVSPSSESAISNDFERTAERAKALAPAAA